MMFDKGLAAELLKWHINRRPAMKARDAYKLIYQGIFGVGHILKAEALTMLVDEAKRVDLNDNNTEDWVEKLPPDGSMIRVNLRPHIMKGFSLNDLFKMMQSSVNTLNLQDFIDTWNLLVEMVMEGKVSIDRTDVINLDLCIDRVDPRPFHHTNEYREAYKPSYRVVALEAFRRVFPDSAIS